VIKTVTLLKRRSDLTSEEFHRHWREVHAPLVLALPGVRRYVQGRVLGAAEFDGVAEVYYDDAAGIETALGSPEYAELLADEENFMGESTGNSIFLTVAEDELAVGNA